MMKRETIPIADIYVPIKRRATLEQKRVDEIAASILDKGLQAPILVRADGARFVLVEGLCLSGPLQWSLLRRSIRHPLLRWRAICLPVATSSCSTGSLKPSNFSFAIVVSTG